MANSLRKTLLRARGPDLAFAAFVALIVGLLVIPVPPALLDVLLATSLSFAVLVLLVVLYVPDALGIATFPTILLLGTLYRLALNVSTSRLILLHGYAGEVITAFGNFVVGGNYFVGAIVFAILTIIQFVVIAKGSERVAEVAARFTLDAMPGKQMAIDAELRAGSIDVNEARRRRRSLARESQFYGAMDGAMKFVKGDVTASLIITAINILGGLAVGILQHNMTAGEALKRYGLLTIGDGLVTQIPALVTSTAAGLLVTRVASEDPDSGLGTELGAQLFGTSRALSAASAFVFLLALVPGLPSVPFAALALILFLLARNRRSTELRTARETTADATPKAPAKAASKGFPFVPVVIPWEVAVGPGFSTLLNKEDDDTGLSLRAQILQLRNVLFSELGLPLPTPRLRVEPELPSFTAIISIREVPIDVLPKLDDGASEAQIDAHSKLLIAKTHKVLLRHGFELLGIGETQLLLDALEQVNGALVRQVVPKPLTLGILSEVLRRLLEERVSIRDLRTILENLAPLAVTEKDPLQLAEAARGFLRRAITFRLTGGARELPIYIVDSSLEEIVRSAITRTPQGAFLTLPPSAARDVQKAVAETLRAAPLAKDHAPVVLCSPDVRRFFRKLLESELPEVFFTSFAELEPELRLVPRARIMPL